MDDNVVNLPVVTRLDIPADRVISQAEEAELAYVIIIGETSDGEFYFASSKASGPDVLWDLEKAKMALLQEGGAFSDE